MIKFTKPTSSTELVLVTTLMREARGYSTKCGVPTDQVDAFVQEHGIKNVQSMPYGKGMMRFITRAEADRVLEAEKQRRAAEAEAEAKRTAPAPVAPDDRFDRMLAEVRANSTALNCLIQAHNHQIALLNRVLTTLGADITVPPESQFAGGVVTK
jgi:hypothetical protein